MYLLKQVSLPLSIRLVRTRETPDGSSERRRSFPIKNVLSIEIQLLF
jgi:hypothetical protein